MGGKASNFIPSNRPESGGADRNELREKSGLLEREKNEFAAKQKKLHEEDIEIARETSAEHAPDEGATPKE